MKNNLNTNHCFIYFGDANDNVYTDKNYNLKKFEKLHQKIMTSSQNKIEALFFQKQTHSADVFLLSNKNQIKNPLDIFQIEGDAIITQEKNIAIGIVTADCLSVILYDEKNQAIAVIHAGWRGLAKNIITKTIQTMHEKFQTASMDLIAYIGPSAGACCYEVQSDMVINFPKNSFEKKWFEKCDQQLFFNPLLAGYDELLKNGLDKKMIHTENHVCTICTPGFCSVRREGENAGRQPSLAVLF